MQVPAGEMLALDSGLTRLEWRRSARARRVSLRIDPRAGIIVVTLPPRAARQAGMSLLMDHLDWINARLAALPGAISFTDGARVPVHGVEHVLRAVGGVRGTARVEGRTLLIPGDPSFFARRTMDFLKAEARRQLTALVAVKAAMAGVQPRRITVKDTRSRWGSCASNRNLAFSWRLVMAPTYVQDYVAAHEVAHLRHMNHGPDFWALVAELSPMPDIAIEWLRTQGPRLLRIGA